MNSQELDIRFELVRKYINAGIDAGFYQRNIFEDMKQWGFYGEVHYKGEPWHYPIDQDTSLDKTKEIDKILVRSAITSGRNLKIEIDEQEFLFLKEQFHKEEDNSVVKEYNLREELMKDEAKKWLPKRGAVIRIDGVDAKLVWIDNPWFKDGELQDLLIRVSFNGEHGSWRRISEIEEIIKV